MIKRAIISVFDKKGLNKLVNELVKWNVELISTSGTADIIRNMGHKVINISNYTNMPEGPDGLFKTLHPMIHVGIIGNPRNLEHKEYMEKHKIKKIDLVVINFYPFEEMVQRGKYNFSKAASHIDLGGVALARTAAKASFLYGRVTVLTSPNQYDLFLYLALHRACPVEFRNANPPKVDSTGEPCALYLYSLTKLKIDGLVKNYNINLFYDVVSNLIYRKNEKWGPKKRNLILIWK